MGIKENHKILKGKSVIISGDIHENLKNYCKVRGIRISFVLEEMIDKFLEEKTIKS